MGYASTDDLTKHGLPTTALATVPVERQQSELDSASNIVDSFLRGRYALPLTSWGDEITEVTCKIAAYNILSVRGYNPASAADVNIRNRYVDAMVWLEKVQKQQAHPNVTPASGQLKPYNQPTVISSSVVDFSTGATGVRRGW